MNRLNSLINIPDPRESLTKEKVFLNTVSIIAELTTSVDIWKKIKRLPEPTSGSTSKGAILNLVPTPSGGFNFIGIFTIWGYWKPFEEIIFITPKKAEELQLEHIVYFDSYYESKKYFSESKFPFPDSLIPQDNISMRNSFRALMYKLEAGIIKLSLG